MLESSYRGICGTDLHEYLHRPIQYDPLNEDVAVIVKEQTESGVGVDVAIECVGNEKALATCMDSVRRRGTLVQVGLPTRPTAVDLHKLVTKDFTFRGSWTYKNTAWPRVISMVAPGAKNDHRQSETRKRS